jgi:hypothetical protein
MINGPKRCSECYCQNFTEAKSKENKNIRKKEPIKKPEPIVWSIHSSNMAQSVMFLRHDEAKIQWKFEILEGWLSGRILLTRNDLWMLRDAIDIELKEFEHTRK